MLDGPGNLNHSELETLANFFIFRMKSDQRQKLIANHPVLYAKMYPGVSTETITRVITSELQEMRNETFLPDADSFANVVMYIRQTKKIQAIREYRAHTNSGLKEAKEKVEAVWFKYNPYNPYY